MGDLSGPTLIFSVRKMLDFDERQARAFLEMLRIPSLSHRLRRVEPPQALKMLLGLIEKRQLLVESAKGAPPMLGEEYRRTISELSVAMYCAHPKKKYWMDISRRECRKCPS